MAQPNPYNDPHHRQALRNTVQRITRTLHELTDLFQTFYELFDEDVNRQTSAERHATLFSVDLTNDQHAPVIAPTQVKLVDEPKRRMVAATNRNRVWTEQENNDLAAMFRYQLTDAQIAEFLQRSVKSVALQRQRLGLKRN